MRAIILGFFPPNNYDPLGPWKYIHFISGLPWSKGAIFQKKIIDFYVTYIMGLVVIDIAMACNISI